MKWYPIYMVPTNATLFHCLIIRVLSTAFEKFLSLAIPKLSSKTSSKHQLAVFIFCDSLQTDLSLLFMSLNHSVPPVHLFPTT